MNDIVDLFSSEIAIVYIIHLADSGDYHKMN